MELLCEVGGEGGPFLVVDRIAAEGWAGADESSADYEQVYALGPLGGLVAVGTGQAVAWDAAGAARFCVYRDDDQVVLRRDFPDDDGAVDPPSSSPSPDASELGTVDVTSGHLVVMWSPFGWTDVTDQSMWEPPGPEGFFELHSPPMANVGAQIPVRPGRYSCCAASDEGGVTCWIQPSAT